MSLPRRVLPGSTYLVTRRCTQRQFLLRPSRSTNGILAYCLARAALLYGIELHAYCFLSNHYHLVLTDPSARLPEFMRYLNELAARALNASLGRWEGLWASGTYSAVELVGLEAVVEKIAYTLANPVAAGLVERAEHWPGLWSHPRRIGEPGVLASRPLGGFFRPNGPTPEQAVLHLVRPQGVGDSKAFAEAVTSALRRHESDAIAAARAAGRAFLGRRGILAQSPTGSPETIEPRRALNPRVATRDPGARIQALLQLRAFIEAYRNAREAFCAGMSGIVFPRGTYWLRIQQHVPCAPS
ncbi:MAG: transposase [Deltaproteobacteria bacterium]|nr:transposase [Deltaproteobacteria bacterium]